MMTESGEYPTNYNVPFPTVYVASDGTNYEFIYKKYTENMGQLPVQVPFLFELPLASYMGDEFKKFSPCYPKNFRNTSKNKKVNRLHCRRKAKLRSKRKGK